MIISAVLMEIQLLKGHCLDFIHRFNLTKFWYLFQARTWISNVMCSFPAMIVFNQLRREVIVRFVELVQLLTITVYFIINNMDGFILGGRLCY